LPARRSWFTYSLRSLFLATAFVGLAMIAVQKYVHDYGSLIEARAAAIDSAKSNGFIFVYWTYTSVERGSYGDSHALVTVCGLDRDGWPNTYHYGN
jgi:hypothetical protein